jgi:hypothetical protein
MRKYYIHNNGGRPFKVTVEDNHVKVYKQTYSEQTYTYTKNPVLDIIAKKVFIGKSPINEMTKFSLGYGPKFDGNSILLDMDNNKYIFIGDKILNFTALSKITSFVSQVGNNDVPYPYAIDEDGRYYLLIENVILTIIDTEKYDDPYTYYYRHSIITTNRGRIPPIKSITKNYNGIVKFYIGNELYTLTYDPFPKKDYARLIEHIGSPIHIINTNGEKILFSSKDYVNLMKSYGKVNGFIPLKMTPVKLIKIK